MSAPKNLELDVANYEDLCHLAELGQKADRSNADLRRASHILRRLLLQGDLTRSTNPRNIKLTLSAPDNKALVRAAENKHVMFWQSGGADVFEVYFRAPMLTSGPNAADLGEWRSEEIIELKLDSFLSQPVFYLEGVFATRKDVINYIANKAAGVHFDQNRKDAYEMLGRCRSGICFKLVDGVPKFSIDLEKFKPIDDTYLPPADSIDPVFFEFYAACQYLSQSPVIKDLLTLLQKELGRNDRPKQSEPAIKSNVRKTPEWTPYRKLDFSDSVPPDALSTEIQYRLHSEDASIPLMIRFASNETGHHMAELSGPSGIFEQRINPQSIFVSVSHPTVTYDVATRGYKVPNGDW
jgi:hypothetical protein